MLLGLRLELQLVHLLDYVAERVAALNLVFDLTEDFADLVFDGVWAAGAPLEARKVREELAIDEIAQIVAGQGDVVVKLAVRVLGRGPTRPTVGLIKDKAVSPRFQFGLCGLVGFQIVQILEEKQPRALLGVIQFARAARIFMQDVINILKSLFKHDISLPPHRFPRF